MNRTFGIQKREVIASLFLYVSLRDADDHSGPQITVSKAHRLAHRHVLTDGKHGKDEGTEEKAGDRPLLGIHAAAKRFHIKKHTAGNRHNQSQ